MLQLHEMKVGTNKFLFIGHLGNWHKFTTVPINSMKEWHVMERCPNIHNFLTLNLEIIVY